MGILADRLDAMRVTVRSRDGQVQLRLEGRSGLALTFAPGYYHRAAEADLERLLSALARLLWVERNREYRAARQAAFGEPWSGEGPPRTARDVAFRQARDELAATGSSPDGRITVTVRGLRSWQVHIGSGTLRALDEHAFTAGARAAAAEVIQDLQDGVMALKAQHLGGPL